MRFFILQSDGTGYLAGTMTVNGVDVSTSFSDIGSGDYALTYTVAEEPSVAPEQSR